MLEIYLVDAAALLLATRQIPYKNMQIEFGLRAAAAAMIDRKKNWPALWHRPNTNRKH